MNKITVLWEPVWYDLDYSMAVGEIGYFKFIKGLNMLKFTTAIDNNEQGEEMKIKILKISNAELSNIVKIDTEIISLSYLFYTDDNHYIQIDAEQTPGLIENHSVLIRNSTEEKYLEDTNFFVEIEILQND